MKNSEHPLLFRENRVWRAYLGGGGIDSLRGREAGGENHFPEDWIASCVEACNDQYRQAGHGISVLADGRNFKEYLAEHAETALGKTHISRFGSQPGFLMKVLDSAERLPIQVHPTVADAEKYYDSDRGKTECWVVTASRRVAGVEPYLLLGFNETADEKIFLDAARQGDFSRSHTMLHKWRVRPGDVFIVPGGVPHAIGPGVTVIEVMEPSDWVVQPEHFCGEQPLTDADRFGPLDKETALKIFHFDPQTREEAAKTFCPDPVLINKTEDFILEAVVPQKVIKLFEVQQLSGSGRYVLQNDCCRAGVVTDGRFEIISGDAAVSAGPGESFFLPAALENCVFCGSGKIVFALPQS